MQGVRSVGRDPWDQPGCFSVQFEQLAELLGGEQFA